MEREPSRERSGGEEGRGKERKAKDAALLAVHGSVVFVRLVSSSSPTSLITDDGISR